jgi:hypothetical protein
MNHEKDLIELDSKISESEIISRVCLSKFLIGFEIKDTFIYFQLFLIEYCLLSTINFQNFLNSVEKPSYYFKSDFKHY